jgi:hypothetical protein
MEVTIGAAGLTKTWQAEFPKETDCHLCKGTARIGFVAHEGMDGELPLPKIDGEYRDFNGDQLVCRLHRNEGKGGYWLHDCCAVAVYFCKDCLNTTALYNQR